MASIKMNFKSMASVMKVIDEKGLSMHKATEDALKGCHRLVTRKVYDEMGRYKVNTGEMRDSIYKSDKVEWLGETARIYAGFNQKQSMHATYMMITGTPYKAPDERLYDAIYGAKTKREIRKIQERAIMSVIGGGQK